MRLVPDDGLLRQIVVLFSQSEKEDVIFIVLEKLNERIPMDDISRSLFAQLMLRMMNATAAQSQEKNACIAYRGRNEFKSSDVMDLPL